MNSQVVIAAATALSVLMAATSLYFSGFQRADAVDVSLVDVEINRNNESEEPTYHVLLINSGTQHSIITKLWLEIPWGARVTPNPVRAVNISAELPIILRPGEINLIRLQPDINYSQAFNHFRRTDRSEPSCGREVNGTNIEMRDVELILYAEGIDSLGTRHNKPIKSINLCLAESGNPALSYTRGPVPLIRVSPLKRIHYSLN